MSGLVSYRMMQSEQYGLGRDTFFMVAARKRVMIELYA